MKKLLLALALLIAVPVAAHDINFDPEYAMDAVVVIEGEYIIVNDRNEPEDAKKMGSGFFISPDGYLVTNFHVVKGLTKPVVYLREGGTAYPANIVELFMFEDLALLKIDVEDVPYLPVGDFSKLKLADEIYALGHPDEQYYTITKGIVSSLDIHGGPTGCAWCKYFKHSANIFFGSSGGPVLNVDGEVVGVNTFMGRNEDGSVYHSWMGFANPANLLENWVRQYVE